MIPTFSIIPNSLISSFPRLVRKLHLHSNQFINFQFNSSHGIRLDIGGQNDQSSYGDFFTWLSTSSGISSIYYTHSPLILWWILIWFPSPRIGERVSNMKISMQYVLASRIYRAFGGRWGLAGCGRNILLWVRIGNCGTRWMFLVRLEVLPM